MLQRGKYVKREQRSMDGRNDEEIDGQIVELMRRWTDKW